MEKLTDNSNLLHSICYNYVIVRQILKYLNWQDLKTVETVCKLWHEVAEDIRKVSLQPYDFGIIFNRKNSNDMTLTSNDQTTVEPGLVLIFMIPRIVHFSFHDSYFPIPSREMVMESTMLQYMHTNFFYSQDNTIGISCRNIFYMPPAKKTRLPKTPVMCGLSMPKIPGVSYHILKISFQEYFENNEDLFHNIDRIMEEEVIKCVLIFLSDRSNLFEDDLISKILTRINSNQAYIAKEFAVGGCHVENLSNTVELNCTTKTPRSNLYNDLSIVFFTVNKKSFEQVKFDAYSLVFSLYVKSKEEMATDFGNKIREFYNSMPKRQFSACFKFSCFKRKYVYETENAILAEIMPNTPIVGCDALGEIGIECTPPRPTNSEPPVKRVRTQDVNDCVHSFSTIVVVLSWGQLL